MTFSFFKKRSDSFDYEITRICKACGNMFHGRYCNRCSEKVTEPHERSVLSFMESLLNAFTFLDGKFIKSLKLVLTKPGALSRSIADGVQTPFMKMVSLFFVANFFYFLFPVMDSFNSSLHTQMNLLGAHSPRAERIENEELVKKNISLEKFTVKYETQSTNFSKLLLILLAIMFTLFLMVVNYSRKVYFFDHLLFSMEFYSFLILVGLVIIPMVALWIIKAALTNGMDWRYVLSDNIYYPMILVMLGYFLFRSQLIFYKQKWYWAIPKSMILLFLMGKSWWIYRILLFYITMWWIE